MMAIPGRRPITGAVMACTQLLLFFLATGPTQAAQGVGGGKPTDSYCCDSSILVVGSLNADTFLPVARLPVEGENLTILPGMDVEADVPGGKGCNQAVACARFSAPSTHAASTAEPGQQRRQRQHVAFLGQFGNDAVATTIRRALTDASVDTNLCGTCPDVPSGRGYVFLQHESGKVSAVVSGGANIAGWKRWEEAYRSGGARDEDYSDGGRHRQQTISDSYLDSLLEGRSCVLLQREVPEYVNYLIARRASIRGITVLQDVGGEDRPMDEAMLGLCDFLIPNASELRRLVKCLGEKPPLGEEMDVVVECARILQGRGAKNVLVTLGERGSILVAKDGAVTVQAPCHLPSGLSVIDETGAGDCYRAGFAVARAEGQSLKKSMQFASAAGALAVTKKGAVPSIPSREEVEDLCRASLGVNGVSATKEAASFLRGGGSDYGANDDECPLMFGSRLNSMKDRPEGWPEPLKDVRDWVKRQGTVRGLVCVDFNYPQHFHTWTNAEAKVALDKAGLVAGAVCLRYPSKFARGAMNHPDPELRRDAIELTKEAAQVARELGCDEVVVWSAYDGYDYPFQVFYDEKWDQIVDAFQECCDAYPDIKFSLEFKPTDENTRFFTVPSTGAAMLLVKEIDRPNMGLTLDMGHMLMAGENPGHSIAMVGDKLFGIQLNDGYTRLAAEDGMMFGSVHPSMALEVIYQLQCINYKGHLYFDTFPQRTDPVKEAEYNIQRVKDFWRAAKKMETMGLREVMDQHDALGALSIVNSVLGSI